MQTTQKHYNNLLQTPVSLEDHSPVLQVWAGHTMQGERDSFLAKEIIANAKKDALTQLLLGDGLTHFAASDPGRKKRGEMNGNAGQDCREMWGLGIFWGLQTPPNVQ